jgi:hypothetical protein
MYTIIFKYNDGAVHGHVCPSREVCGTVLEDVMHHIGGSVAAWVISDSSGRIEGHPDSWMIDADETPEYMRVEWS